MVLNEANQPPPPYLAALSSPGLSGSFHFMLEDTGAPPRPAPSSQPSAEMLCSHGSDAAYIITMNSLSALPLVEVKQQRKFADLKNRVTKLEADKLSWLKSITS